MKPYKNLETKTPWDTYWRVQLVCKKVQAHLILEPPLQYNQDQMPLTNQGSYDLFSHLGSYRNIIHFQINYRRENDKKIPESSRLEFLEKFSANNFAWSDAEVNTSGSLNRGGKQI